MAVLLKQYYLRRNNLFQLNNQVKDIIRDSILYLLLSVATFGMLITILQYVSFKEDVGFLLFKQSYLDNTIWKVAFYVHVFSAVITLFAGFTQFSETVIKDHRSLHRTIGKIYVFTVIFINFPSGMILAIYANGGLSSKLAFIILDSLWFWFTLKAVIEIKKKNISAHRIFMIRSYALTLSALTLRTWKIILVGHINIDAEHIYMLNAWLGFVPNLLFAEWLIRKSKNYLLPKGIT